MWWLVVPRFVEAGIELKEPEWRKEWMNEWINQSINPSKFDQFQSLPTAHTQEWYWSDCWISPITCRIRHLRLGTSFRQDSTRRSLHHLIYYMVGMSVCRCYSAVVHFKSSKIHQCLLKTRDSHLFKWPTDILFASLPWDALGIWANLSSLRAYPLVSPIICAKLEQVQWKYIETTWNNLSSTDCLSMFLVCQDLSQFKSRWTHLRLIQYDSTKSVANKKTLTNKESCHDKSWIHSFFKAPELRGHGYGCQSHPTIVDTPCFVPLSPENRMACHFQGSPSFTVTTLTLALRSFRIKLSNMPSVFWTDSILDRMRRWFLHLKKSKNNITKEILKHNYT